MSDARERGVSVSGSVPVTLPSLAAFAAAIGTGTGARHVNQTIAVSRASE